MLNLSIDLSHLALYTLPLPTFLMRFTRTDGVIVRVTDAESSVTVDGQTFDPLFGCSVSAIHHALGGEMPSCEIAYSHAQGETIDPFHLDNGFWDAAALKVYLVDRMNLPATLDDECVFTGVIGTIEFDADAGLGTFDCRGLTAQAEAVLQTFGPMCQTDVFSELCGLDPDDHEQAGTVATVEDAFTITVTGLSNPDAPFSQGTGETDAGYRFNIVDAVNNSGTLTVRLGESVCEARFEVGQSVTLWPGCDKRAVTCRDVYNNKINPVSGGFQGEDHILGVNSIAGI